ncbi:MAG: EAL domain-containing protein [Methylovulum sp.]|nr:EAL domain-containing protein [Methylovulum sp.]
MLKDSLFRKTYLAYAVLGIGLLATVFISFQVKQGIEQKAVREFASTSDRFTLKIQERLDAYALILRGGAALFAASNTVERKEWQTYVESLHVERNIPGVQGIGFAQVIPTGELADHTARIRSEGFTEYTVHPSGARDPYTSIVYLEPFRDRNLRAFGFDMYSEPVRHAAMDQARDTGEAALSGKVELVQETGTEIQAGILMYVPVYRNGMPKDTASQRRSALIGWVYSPYRMNDFMAGIFRGWAEQKDKTVALTIYDGREATPTTLLFDSKPDNSLDLQLLFKQQRVIDFNGHQWLLVFDNIAKPSSLDYTDAWATLIGGLTLNGLLFGLMLSLLNMRANAVRIADQLTKEIRHSHELLQESEFRWKFAIEGPGDGLLDWNLANNTVFFSKSWKRMLGYAEDEIGNSLEELTQRIHPADMAIAHATMQDFLNGKTPNYVNEFRVRCKDGGYKWILDSGMVVNRNEDGKPLRIIVTHRDITPRKLMEEKLRIREAQLSIITSSAKDAIIMQNEAGDITFWNEAAEKLFGYAREECIGRNLHMLLSPVRFREAHLKAFPDFQQTGQGGAVGKTVELAGLRKDGSEFSLELSLSSVQVDIAWHSIGIVRDITERKQSEEKLLLAASVFTHAREGIMIAKLDGTIIDINDAFKHITGYSREEVQGCNLSILNSDLQEKDFYTTLWHDLIDKGHWAGEIWNRRKNGKVFAAMETISAVRDIDGAARHYVALFSDITPIKEYEKRLEHIAQYDALTNLPNRVLLTDRLHQGMAQTRRRGKRLAVAFIDLDGFKAINDNHGHKAGDLLLIAVASRMEQTLRAGDTIARLGGDEFVAVLIDLTDTETTLPMLGRLLAAAAQPVQAGELTLQVSASLGATFYPQTEDIEADQLLRQADQAMYQAKLAGKNRYHIFNPEQDKLSRSLHESLDDIRRALAAHEFVLYYQPKVNMRTGTMIGAEALIRWQHPKKGLLPPSVFLPVIEDDPLAVEFGEWVIDTALGQMALWQADGLHIPVSINIGAHQLQQANFVERLCALLAAHPSVSPGDLELEVLETSAMGDLAKVTHAIVAGRKLGVRFTLDDFGTGYSSLTYLNHLPVTQLKIDQRFIRGMLDDTDDMAILEGILGLATAFRQQIIAEGVETVEHGTMLLQLGCELAQGYGIAHPMPADQIPDWSATWRPDPAWLGLHAVSRVDLPLLFASLEHSTWIAAVEACLRGEREAPPPLNSRQCRFGNWLVTEGQAQHSAQPAFQIIGPLHHKVHELASELLELQAQGRNLEVQARLDELHGLREALLEQLKALAPEIPKISDKGNLE